MNTRYGHNNIRHHGAGISLRYPYALPTLSLRYISLLLLMMFLGGIDAWGAFTEGLYYIKSNSNTAFYLCPSIGCYYGNNIDQPHLTTFKTGGDQYSIWKIVPVEGETDTYYLIHYKTGRYLKSNEDFTTDNGSKHNRKAVHLEVKPETFTDEFKFLIKNSSSPYQIYPKSYYINASSMSFNPTSGHKECYAPADGGVQGIIGLYNKDDGASKWQITTVATASTPCATPIIKYDGGNITISYPYSDETGVTIYYTTDGTDPSTSGTKLSYSAPITASGVIKVRAIATKTDIVNSDEAVLWGNARPFLIQSKECADYYLVPSGNNINVCTTSIPGTGMQWTLQDAGTSTGGVQYYYVVNSNNKKIKYAATFGMDEGQVEDNKFCIVENGYNTGDFFLIPVSATGKCVYKNSGNVDAANSKSEVIKLYSGDNFGRDKWILRVCNESADQKNLFSGAPFNVSDNNETHYYHIANVGATGYYIVPPTDADGYATTSDTNYTNSPWIFKVAATDNWQTYYYIINAASGKYMYFNPNNNQTKDQENVISLKDISEKNAENEEKFQFIMVRSTTTGACYIVSKGYSYADTSHKNFNGNTYFGLWFDDNNPAALKTTWSRKSTVNHVKWTFEEATITNLYLAPVFSQDENGYVSITHPTAACDYYYTTDGSTPTVPASAETAPTAPTYKYTGSFRPEIGVTQIKAKAVLKSNYSISSEVGTFDLPAYTKPTISYDNTTNTATITSATEGATIYYTTDGSTDPTVDESVAHGTSPVTIPNITSETTIKAIAINAGYTASGVETVTIEKVATPTFELTTDGKVKISSTTPGVTIYYTYSNEGTPANPTTSSTEYTGPLPDMAGYQFKAIAVKSNWINSDIGETSGAIKLRCAAPNFTRMGKGVSLASSFPTSDVSYKYTIADNGASPADPKVSGTAYTGVINLSSYTPTITVKAYAYAEGYDDSDVSTFELTSWGAGTQEDPYYITTQAEFNAFITNVNSNSNGEASAYYRLITDVSASSADAITTSFSGSFDGNGYTISGLTHPLFNTINGGVVKNVTLKYVAISSSEDNVGAIAGIAQGYSRIYNCGILPNDATFPEGTHPSVSTSGACAGGIVGKLDGDSRVINCFSYADVSASTRAAGIVGQNTYNSTSAVTGGKYADLKTAVVNCMFYGNITGGTNQHGVYGGELITNAASNGISSYNYYSSNSTFNTTSGEPTAYNCSFPAEERYLTQVEFHRSLLNSNRELCGWWVGSEVAPSTLTTTEVQAIPKDASLMYKWVVDPSVAPYPILKPFGKYASVINGNTGTPWVDRATANPYEGKQLGTLSVTVNSGDHSSAGNQILSIPITDMDTLHYDYGYRKIQLPYYNTVFGNPEADTWAEKYANNYTDQVVTGWKITGVTTDGSVETYNDFVADWQDGYNFADRKCTDKDVYEVSGRVFAQGGYYYVPDGVIGITIEAYWGKAIYVRNNGGYYDRVNITLANTGSPFEPAGTRGNNVNGATIQTTTKLSDALTSTNIDAKKTVYDYALVLVGNVQESVGKNDFKYSASDYRGFTIMSVDLDFDEEPDYCLEWQLGAEMNRQVISPIRFDFLPVVELGIAGKLHNSTNFYSLGCYRSQGHFEVTETSFIRFGQFEFELKDRDEGPVILNGGIYDQYCRGRNGETNQHINYVILGGHIVMPSFTPGAHVNEKALYQTRHCAVNALGGNFTSFYLTGGYNEGITPYEDNPHCYIDGGRFGTIAAAFKEGIFGDVTWRINHALIDEFYGGGVMSQATGTTYKIVKGSIDVVIDNSIVGKYCGGPKFGDMVEGKTVKTSATGTTFNQYYGAGNGGTNYVQYKNTDATGTPITNWSSTITSNYTVGKYRSKAEGYEANYDIEIINTSTGDQAGKVVNRSYYYSAQFATTNTGNVTSTLTDCTIKTNFYGGGFLGGVTGDVTSTLNNCTVVGSVFGAGYSADAGTVTIHNTDKVAPKVNTSTGIIKPQSGGTSETYFWTNDAGTTSDPITTVGDKKYYYTEVSLDNLGAVSGNVTLTINGNTVADENGKRMLVGKSVYGGGEESGVGGNTIVSVTGGTIGVEGQGGAEYGNVYGGGKGKDDNVQAGLVKGNTQVTISGTPTIYHNVYGGGAYGSVGDFKYDSSNNITGINTDNDNKVVSGKCTVTITGGTFGWNGKENGMVFGSSRGDVGAPGAIEDRLAWVYNTEVVIGTSGSDTGPQINGSVYGGGENGHNYQNSSVAVYSGTIGIPTGDDVVVNNADNSTTTYAPYNYPYRGNVYGGGCGTDEYDSDGDGKMDAYNPLAGIVRGNATVNITGGHVVHNVYGAGAMGSVGNADDASSGKTTVTISGGRLGYDGSRNGNVFGAARGEYGISTAASGLATVRESEVNISYTTTPDGDNTKKDVELITGSVFGGGEAGIVKGSVTVNMTGGMILKDIYGGGALADTQTSNWDATANSGAGGWAVGKTSASTTTTVRLTGGTILGEAYGGGLGEAGKPAYVYGDVLLDLNGTTTPGGATGTPIDVETRGCAVSKVFGCNNVNGSPKGTATVHIYATQNANRTQIANEGTVTNAKVKGTYDVQAVYGGGDMAAYEPADLTNGTTNVIIDGCRLTSIQTVYGGGNAASTPATSVTVNGTFEIEEVFGGGNGKDAIGTDAQGNDIPNPGANVGFRDYSAVEDTYNTKEKRQQSEFIDNYVYGSGRASVNIFGGKIHRVFGGSNTKGNVRLTAVTLLEEAGGCDFDVDEAYGGGKSAPMDAEAKLLMACIPGLKAVYGGAEAADIRGNVTLNITNGTFDRVFGGNNISGTITGSITVNIEEVGCRPIIIGELYGGGNQAAYSVYGYDANGNYLTSGDNPQADPQVNVMSFTSIGNIYGGGYGTGAVMVGNPTVNINEVLGTPETYPSTGDFNETGYKGKEITFEEGTENEHTVILPNHIKNNIGSINYVFGGGNAAQVIGNTCVNIGTLAEVYVIKNKVTGDVTGYYTRNNDGTYSAATGTAQEGTTYYEKQEVKGVDIRGNVYGGGNNAEVTGNTNVNIGRSQE